MALSSQSARARLAGLVERALPLIRGRHFAGLDINTTSTGLVLLDHEGKLLHASVADTSAHDDVLDIAQAISDAVAAEVAAVPVAAGPEGVDVCVEDFLRAFSTGNTNATTLFRLAQVNSVAQYALWRRTGRRPRVAFSQTIRAAHSLPADDAATAAHPAWADLPPLPARARDRGSAKLAPMAYAAAALGPHGVAWPRTPRGLLSDAAFDIADAFLCASYARAAAVGDAAVDGGGDEADALLAAAAEARARRSPAALEKCLRSAGIRGPSKRLRGDDAWAALRRSANAMRTWMSEERDRARRDATLVAARIMGL